MKSRINNSAILGIAITLAIIAIWLIPTLLTNQTHNNPIIDKIQSVLTAAIGAFFGAYFAFQLRRHEEKTAATTTQKAAINAALIILLRQINTLTYLKKEFDKHPETLGKAFQLPAFQPPNYSDLKQDFKSLNFLIENEQVNTILNLSIEQERFEQAMCAINIRNKFYVDEIQPAFSSNKLNDRIITSSEIKEAIGERLFCGAVNGANTMCEHTNATIISLKLFMSELREVAKKIFPQTRFIVLDETRAKN